MVRLVITASFFTRLMNAYPYSIDATPTADVRHKSMKGAHISGKHPGLLHDIFWNTREPDDVLPESHARLDPPKLP